MEKKMRFHSSPRGTVNTEIMSLAVPKLTSCHQILKEEEEEEGKIIT